MKKGTRILTILLLFVFIGGIGYTQNSATKQEWPAYFLSILIGFGTGHFYLGDENGKYFLIGGLTGTGLLIGGLVYLRFSDTRPEDRFETMMLLTLGGVSVFLIARVWEIIDIFFAVDRARKKGEIAQFEPYIDVSPTRTGFGISFKF